MKAQRMHCERRESALKVSYERRATSTRNRTPCELCSNVGRCKNVAKAIFREKILGCSFDLTALWKQLRANAEETQIGETGAKENPDMFREKETATASLQRPYSDHGVIMEPSWHTEFVLEILCALTTLSLRFHGAHNVCTALSRRLHRADGVLKTQ